MGRGSDGALSRTGGLYALVCTLPQAVTLPVGHLGEVAFPAGWYVYVGSARGPGGFRARVGRHLRRAKRVRWHVDRLLAWAEVREVWGKAGEVPRECTWATALAQAPGACRWPPGFGASDCRCKGHLIALPEAPAAEAFRALGAERLWPQDCTPEDFDNTLF
ncbi:MAG: GIY-YIG nuclease family protein [Anaerolineae bacterium]